VREEWGVKQWDTCFSLILPSCSCLASSDVMDRLAAALGGYEAADGSNAAGGADAAAGSAAAAPSDSAGGSTGAARGAGGASWGGVGYVRVDGSHDMLSRREVSF
jgi:hypothetical protein